ncbi:hypothetical protein VNO77_03783 [Canavalia gladiata]|uniref:Uncharacterized protein n=1 Tax=Canavalia gladiata TaxID=3824 RepID=A0AAN9MVY2_CANGL
MVPFMRLCFVSGKGLCFYAPHERADSGTTPSPDPAAANFLLPGQGIVLLLSCQCMGSPGRKVFCRFLIGPRSACTVNHNGFGSLPLGVRGWGSWGYVNQALLSDSQKQRRRSQKLC